jgi:hypothetical protein
MRELYMPAATFTSIVHDNYGDHWSIFYFQTIETPPKRNVILRVDWYVCMYVCLNLYSALSHGTESRSNDAVSFPIWNPVLCVLPSVGATATGFWRVQLGFETRASLPFFQSVDALIHYTTTSPTGDVANYVSIRFPPDKNNL